MCNLTINREALSNTNSGIVGYREDGIEWVSRGDVMGSIWINYNARASRCR